MQIALHTVLRPGLGPDYDRLHQTIPPALTIKLRQAGVHDWRIWRDGDHVFHLVEVEDYHAMRAALRDDPDNQVWQDTVGPLFAQADSYEGGDDGLRSVWTLSSQPPVW